MEEEATNTLVYRESALGAMFKADHLRPYENFADVSTHAPAKRKYSYAVLQGSSTDITNLDTSAVGANNIDHLSRKFYCLQEYDISCSECYCLVSWHQKGPDS